MVTLVGLVEMIVSGNDFPFNVGKDLRVDACVCHAVGFERLLEDQGKQHIEPVGGDACYKASDGVGSNGFPDEFAVTE